MLLTYSLSFTQQLIVVGMIDFTHELVHKWKMDGYIKKVRSLSHVQLFVTPWTVAYQAPLWNFPGKSTGLGYHFLLQGTFLTQGSNLGLPHCRQTLYLLSHQGSPGWLHGWCLKIQLQSQPLPHSTQQVSESSPQQALHSSSCRKHSHTRRGAPIFFLSILPKHLLGHEQKL